MRLIETKSNPIRVVEFLESDIPPYAILSHCWGTEEVTLLDLSTRYDEARKKKGFEKIQGCVKQANDDGFDYVWIDTCWQVRIIPRRLWRCSLTPVQHR